MSSKTVSSVILGLALAASLGSGTAQASTFHSDGGRVVTPAGRVSTPVVDGRVTNPVDFGRLILVNPSGLGRLGTGITADWPWSKCGFVNWISGSCGRVTT